LPVSISNGIYRFLGIFSNLVGENFISLIEILNIYPLAEALSLARPLLPFFGDPADGGTI